MIGLIEYWWLNVCLVNRNAKWNERGKLRSTLNYFKNLNVDIMVNTGSWQIWKGKNSMCKCFCWTKSLLLCV